MKKLILLLLCAVSSFSLAATQASDGSNLRDSIFRIYRSMPADTARTQFLKDLFVHNIDKDWSAELLDSALASAISMKDVESELALRYEYFRYYTFRLDGENMDKALALLKEVCYRSKIYGKNTTKVGNIKAYLLAALYNAPATMDSYYRAEVNHDLYGC